MADREIKITFPEKKMEALAFFLGEQNEKIEDVLTAHLDKTYEKYVPQQVRKFVGSQMAVPQEENTNTRRPRTQNQPAEQGRRNSRQGAGRNTSRQEGGRRAENSTSPEQENETVESMAEPEEAQGMNMGM